MYMLSPPEYFGIVEPNVFRCNHFSAINFPFIRKLKLKTLLVLSSESSSKAVLAFMEELQCKYHLGCEKVKNTGGWRPIEDELIKEGLEMVLNERFHPILISCSSGIHETGVLVGCLRRMQQWNFNAIIFEYRSFAGNKSKFTLEQYIELFDKDLITLPEKEMLPKWFTINHHTQ